MRKDKSRLRDIQTVWLITAQLEDSCFRDISLQEYPEIMRAKCDREGVGIPSAIDHMRFVAIPADADTDDVGFCDMENRTLAVRIDEHAQFDYATLAHELIHYYEHMLDEVNPALRQFVAIQLYQRAREYVPDINRHIIDFLEADGGVHDILFLLKSWDIDWMNDLPLGTVSRYSSTEGVAIP